MSKKPKNFALVDDYGDLIGFYDDRRDAERDLADLGNPDDVGIIEIPYRPTKADHLRAVRNWMKAVINHRWQ